ncbi:MAG: histidine kinase, partial [Bacteroidota bacterium]
SDSLKQIDRESVIDELSIQYETEKKEAEIKSLSQQAEIQALQIRQRNQAIGIGVALFILIIVILYFLNAQRDAKKQRKQIELEQRFLRSQLNPHFISNALVAVQSSLLEKDIASAENYLTTFSRLMREMLENSRAEQIPIEDEVSMLRDYLEINKKRLKSGFDFFIEVADEIDQEFDTIPPMLIQPFVENAIEHGIAPKDENLVIDISFHKEESGIRVIVKDNGGGLKEAKVDSSKESLSTQIIKERLALFNQSLKEKMSLSIQNWKDEKQGRIGLEVTLKIPQG